MMIVKPNHLGLVEGDVVLAQPGDRLWIVERAEPNCFVARAMTRWERFWWWFNYEELI